jgi:para-aminobenzoate synthetase/4-amino-4-deoxychorismate lyase
MAPGIEALVQVEDGARWLRLTAPVRIVEASRPEEIAGALRTVERLSASLGCHAVGFVQYETACAFGLAAGPASTALPLVWFALFPAAAGLAVAPPEPAGSYQLGPVRAAIDPRTFVRSVRTIRRHIADGDTYQVNYTFPLRAAFRGDPASLFADLTRMQQGRYSVYIRIGGQAICSASPELFFARTRGQLVARPMKGTAPRGLTPEADERQAERLRSSLKERAENVMIVDMMRNDLGRVASVGSVTVPALFTLEAYPTVWQLTSTIEATSGAPLDAVFEALFPAASVTGAPQVRTMQIISTLEPEPRGVYTGAIGYVAPDGRTHFNVAIRTAVVDLERDALVFGVGSGIVWDSDPEREYEECLLKGAILGRQRPSFDLLETLRWTPRDGFLRLDRHLRRLQASARYFGFVYSEPAARAALDRVAAHADGPQRVRLLLASDGRVRTEHRPFVEHAAPWRLRFAARPVDPSDVFLFHKTTDRSRYEAFRLPDCDDVVLWNAAGEITESTIANIVADLDGELVTPPVGAGLLPGTFRAELLAAGRIVERSISLGALRRARALWLVNSLRGWCTACLVD